MTRKDYELLAEAIGKGVGRVNNLVNAQAVGDSVVGLVMTALATDNPRFDAKRFYDAYRATRSEVATASRLI